MRSNHIIALATALGLCLSQTGNAQSSGGEFTIERHTIDNGGGASAGGNFSLRGSIGQPDAAEAMATGGVFGLRGGFWRDVGPVVPPIEILFSDSFETLMALTVAGQASQGENSK